MSILIKGMEMPKNCWECQCEIVYPSYGRSVCGITSQFTINNRDTRREDCPLIELPPHGRLIDADQFRKDNEEYWDREFDHPRYEDTLSDLVNAAPTIIPADKDGAE